MLARFGAGSAVPQRDDPCGVGYGGGGPTGGGEGPPGMRVVGYGNGFALNGVGMLSGPGSVLVPPFIGSSDQR